MIHRFFLGLVVVMALVACQPATNAPEPLPLPDLVIGVAPFTQPIQVADLLAGYIPEQQYRVDAATLAALDEQFAAVLAGTGREYRFLSRAVAEEPMTVDVRGRRGALITWINRARLAGVDLLIVPQLIDWRERDGGPTGVISPAAVMTDIFLIDAREPVEGPSSEDSGAEEDRRGSALLQRSHYAEEQQALAENLFSVGAFFKRKGQWVTASELAGEAMNRAVEEFGL